MFGISKTIHIYNKIKCSYFSIYQFLNLLQKIQVVWFFHMRDWVACSSSCFSPPLSAAAAAAAAAADSNSGTVFSRAVAASELDAGFSTLGGVSVVFLVLLPFAKSVHFTFFSARVKLQWWECRSSYEEEASVGTMPFCLLPPLLSHIPWQNGATRERHLQAKICRSQSKVSRREGRSCNRFWCTKIGEA